LLNYTARALSGAVCLNDEAEEFLWLTPADALMLDLNQATRALITEVTARKWIALQPI